MISENSNQLRDLDRNPIYQQVKKPVISSSRGNCGKLRYLIPSLRFGRCCATLRIPHMLWFFFPKILTILFYIGVNRALGAGIQSGHISAGIISVSREIPF